MTGGYTSKSPLSSCPTFPHHDSLNQWQACNLRASTSPPINSCIHPGGRSLLNSLKISRHSFPGPGVRAGQKARFIRPSSYLSGLLGALRVTLPKGAFSDVGIWGTHDSSLHFERASSAEAGHWCASPPQPGKAWSERPSQGWGGQYRVPKVLRH